MITLLHKPLVRHDAEFVKRDDTSIGRKDHFVELELPLLPTVSTGTMLCLYSTALQIDLSAMRASLTSARFSTALAASALKTMRTDDERMVSHVAELSSTVDKTRLNLGSAQSTISASVFELLRSKRNQNFRAPAFHIWSFRLPSQLFHIRIGKRTRQSFDVLSWCWLAL